MRQKEKTSSFKKRILISGAAFLLLVLVMAAFFGEKGLLEIYKARQKKTVLIHRIESLENRKARLEMEIQVLKTNPEAVEEKAREKLWMVLPDEIVIVRKDRW
jgi:cell division protein FtsB